jgi:inner membrane protein
MDNATHTLAAILVAEAALLVRSRHARDTPPALRFAALAVSVAANNFPDLDFVYAGITGGKLGYLLHHRGHTHTLATALPQAAAALALVAPFVRRARQPLGRPDWYVLALLALVGPVVHIAMDFSNNYGVHPFWPLNNRWYYGDFVFIVEPLLFCAIVPALFWSARTRLGRALLGLTLLTVLGLMFASGIVPLAMSVAVAVLAFVLFVVLRRAAPITRVLVALLASSSVALAFFAASRIAEARLHRFAVELFPRAITHDIIATPLPANPLCFDFILVQTEAEAYVLRPGMLSLGPANPGWCGKGVRGARTLELAPENVTREPLALAGRFAVSRASLAELAASCQGLAFLRFARAPFVAEAAAGGGRAIGDARYDREPGLGFAELSLDARSKDCPRFVPPWLPPRGELWR